MALKTSSAKCRACICSLGSAAGCYDMRQLPKLAHKFVTCTDLSPISGEDRLPSELCQACHDQLERLYAFRARCIAADTKWRMEILAFCEEMETPEAEEPEKEEAATSSVETELAQCQTKEPVKPVSKTLELQTPQLESTARGVEFNTEQLPTKSIYKCDICATQFLEQHRLQAHKRQHGLMPYPCPEPGCDRGYSHKNTLSVHMRKCHKLGKEHKSHVCEFCGKTFDTMWRLKNHRFTHKDKSELPYVCEDKDCGRRFSSKQLLKVHTMRHAGIKNYRCTYCGVQKTTRTELKIHLNYHTLERTYSCRICSKVCNSSSNLNLHMRTVHERSRNYACTYCERTFTQPSLRKQHELIHTGEKPHECEECGRHFRQKAALRTHRKIHERQSSEGNSNSATTMISEPIGNVPLLNASGTVLNEFA